MVTWSLGVQLGTVLLIAIFFAILARSVRLEEVRLWTAAWFMEATALTASFFVVADLVNPDDGHPGWLRPLFLSIYCIGKTLFAIIFVHGTRSHFQPGALWNTNYRWIAAAAVVWGFAVGFWAPVPPAVLPVQWLVTGSLLLLGGFWALRGMEGRARWLGWVLLGEGLLFLSYIVPFLLPVLEGKDPLSGLFLFSSLIDSGAELLLALATLVALESSQSRHLQRLNDDLYAAFERLGQLVDYDPLTGLINRRGLRRALEAARSKGGAVMFLDIDGFKAINDRHGHAAGDACLVRAAQLLTRHFRPEDSLIRWGGDELLVIAPELSAEAAEQRMQRVREALREGGADTPQFTVSVGIARLEPGGEPNQALKAADEAMYADKRRLALSLRM
ncbi:MAG: GGDEF domain-containing protein [Acidobacteria bacterium]|nr:GGDEF domain-containing protein [Acidobacteriota bacterium]